MTTIRNAGYKDFGPDTSKVPSSLGGPKYSFGSRFDGIPFDHPALSARRRLVERDNCQPTFYNPPSTLGTAPGVKINPPHSSRIAATGKASLSSSKETPRDPSIKMNIPGPIMMRQQERSQNAVDIAPGPGAYDAVEAYNYAHPSLVKSIGGVATDYKQGNEKGAPGPGAYNPRLLGRIPGPVLKAQTARRYQPIEKKPVVRDTGDNFREIQMKTARPTFGKGQRGDLAPKTITPGPDAYQRIEGDWKGKPIDPDKETCKFGMKTSKFFQANKYPGPGTYDINHTPYGEPAFSMGTSARTGPVAPMYTDSYYYPKNLFPGPAVSFTMEPRQYEYKKSKYPGPGMYDIPDTVGIIPEYLLNGGVSD